MKKPAKLQRKVAKKQHKDDLFNNPMVRAAKEALSPEQQAEYKRIGEYMYANTKFEAYTSNSPNDVVNRTSLTTEMIDAIEYIELSIRSGQHISTLEENEKIILSEAYGEKWFERYGFTEADVTQIN